MGGATTIGRFLERFGPHGSDVRLAGLCDVAEERAFKRGLRRAGFGPNLTRADMEALGFYVCDADLEDELIRALGVAAVEQIVDAQGELASFRTLQKQPAQRGRSVEAQLRRFMGTRGGRKIRYAPLLVEALELTRVPRPLADLRLLLTRRRVSRRVPAGSRRRIIRTSRARWAQSGDTAGGRGIGRRGRLGRGVTGTATAVPSVPVAAAWLATRISW